MRHSFRRSWLLVGLFMALIFGSNTAQAIDPFEIQIYDSETNAPSAFGLELHSIYRDHSLHETLEPSIGITSWFELGGYVQTAYAEGGSYEYAGVKLRGKARLFTAGSVAFAVNGEVSFLPRKYSDARWGSEVRPVIEWREGPFSIRVNPIVSFDWGGQFAAVPHLEPGLSATWDFEGLFAPGLEYFADFGPITQIPAWQEQEHLLFETLNVTALEGWELHAGVGEGLTRASSTVVLKAILGHTF